MEKDYDRYIEGFLKHLSHLTAEEIDFLRPQLAINAYRKKDFFLERGQIQKELGFLMEGLVRRYYINEKANDITTGFIKEYEYVTDYPAFIRQQPTQNYIQCLEPTVIVTIPYENIQESYVKFKHGQLYGRIMAEQVLTIYNDRIESFLFNTAEERYLKFMSEQADLMNRISLSHLCSFLGIERQSLSRIRKRLTEK